MRHAPTTARPFLTATLAAGAIALVVGCEDGPLSLGDSSSAACVAGAASCGAAGNASAGGGESGASAAAGTSGSAGTSETCAQPTGAGIATYQSLPKKGSMTGTGRAGELSATLAALPGPEQVSFPLGTFEMVDFADPSNDPVYGAYFASNVLGLRGTCAHDTVFQLHPHSSTKASRVPTQAEGGTNQLTVMRFDAPNILLSGFTLNATDQGHTYNGLVLYKTTGARLNDVTVRGVPGDDGTAPGDTFSVNDYRASGTTLTGVELDGRDASGAKVAASLLGSNYSSGMSMTDSYLHDAQYAGVGAYGCTGAFDYTRVNVHNTFVGFDFTECSNATVVLDHCDFAGNGRDLVVDSNVASIKVTVKDPVLVPGHHLLVTIHPYYDLPQKPVGQQSPNQQRQVDIKLYVAGVERPDLIDFLTN